MKRTLILLLALILVSGAAAQNNKNKKKNNRKRPNTSVKSTPRPDTTSLADAVAWADAKMKHMSLSEKVGQLLFVRVPTSMN